ncbi:MAG: biotin--[acetyl-CoA-carboxylase] ligase [Planctomycetota bacterium]
MADHHDTAISPREVIDHDPLGRGGFVEALPWLLELTHCASTNSHALAHLEQLAHGTCIYTPRQHAGRGQHGRSWLAPVGVLTASFVLDLKPGPGQGVISLAAGLALIDTLELHCPQAEALAIKWPNDVYAHDRKLAGILCEARSVGGQLRVVIGIGCNLDPDWAAAGIDPHTIAAQPPISMKDLGAQTLDRYQLLTQLRHNLLSAVALINAGRWLGLCQRLREHDALLGRSLRVSDHHGDDIAIGTGAGIDDDGALLISSGEGSHFTITNGTVTIL